MPPKRSKAYVPSKPGRRLVLTLNELRQRQLVLLAADVNLRPEQLAAVWLIERIDNALEVSQLHDSNPRGSGALGEGSTAPIARSTGAVETTRSLHEEIVEVLRESGPMPVSEIAEVIRSRGQYRPPRSRHPISSATISRRISNPQYRSLFARDGRTVGLAPSARASK